MRSPERISDQILHKEFLIRSQKVYVHPQFFPWRAEGDELCPWTSRKAPSPLCSPQQGCLRIIMKTTVVMIMVIMIVMMMNMVIMMVRMIIW